MNLQEHLDQEKDAEQAAQETTPDLGFASPVGTEEERASGVVWPGHWVDATGYATRYLRTSGRLEYHTGADLNLNFPHFDADQLAPCFSPAKGLVVFAGTLPVWGHVLVIKHETYPLPMVWSRFGHLEDIVVREGDKVVRGTLVGHIGNGKGGDSYRPTTGTVPYHLHFDIAQIDLGVKPGDWPGANLQRVQWYYFDPRLFILHNQTIKEAGTPAAATHLTDRPIEPEAKP